jgi:hypothetical protein
VHALPDVVAEEAHLTARRRRLAPIASTTIRRTDLAAAVEVRRALAARLAYSASTEAAVALIVVVTRCECFE